MDAASGELCTKRWELIRGVFMDIVEAVGKDNIMTILPRDNSEVISHLIENGAKENYVRWIAYQMGEDFDEDPPDQFNRFNNNQKENEF